LNAPVLLLASLLLGGIGELALDRGAITDLVAAAMPEPVTIGPVTLTAGRPTPVDFIEGGVETSVPVRVDELGWKGVVDLRYEPRVRPENGGVHLAAVRVRPRVPLPVEFDLSRWAPLVELPRRLEWDLPLAGGASVRVICFVQGLEIDDERLRVELGLVTQP